MNNISDNPYLKNRYTSLNKYSLNTFLFRDVAVEHAGNRDEIKLALGNILAAHGFNINLIGFKFILNLSARYLIKSDYDEVAEIQTIADIYGTIPNIVRDSIKACVNYNRRFIKSASAELGYNIDSSKALEIEDVVEIIGALFKINYNYIADSEITDDGRRAVNFVRMTLNHG